MWIGNFFCHDLLVALRWRAVILTNHVGYCVEASQSETCLQQPEKPANSSWPAGVCAHVEISMVSLGPEIDDETDLAKPTTFRHRQGS